MLSSQLLSRIIPIALSALLLLTEVIDDLFLSKDHINFFMVFEAIVVVLLAVLVWREIIQREKAEQNANEAQERSERLAGDLANHIDANFQQWNLTQAEHDIAWLLLKGFTFSEMAQIRQVKEKTLRQQATSIYAKGNISSRSELAATFLQDVLLSPEDRSKLN